MPRSWLAQFLVLPGLAVLFASSVTPSSAPSLDDRIEELLQRENVSDAFWGVALYDLEAEETVYGRNASQAFLPASTQKVITSAAAIDILGSSHRYETTLYYDGSVQGAVMQGDLVLEGSGDPTFGSSEVPGDDPLQKWSERLAEMGVERIEGRLIADDDVFDDQRYPDGWIVNYLTDQKGRHMGNSGGGLVYRDNVVPVRVRATRPGQAPSVETQPENILSVTNRAETSSRWRGNTLQVNRTFSTNELVLTGSVARSYNGTLAVPVSDPTAFVLKSFEKRLHDAGIQTDLELLDVDDLNNPPDPDSPLFVEFSRPLAEITSEINKRSNNFYAEQVFRTYAWGGSIRGAAKRTKTFLRTAGIDTRNLLLHDGSGLSRKNLVTPESMVKLLAHMDDHEERASFMASLPTGGERNTTLNYRLRQVDVRAKTGSLEFVSALTGYTTRADGRQFAFAIFANNFTGPSYHFSRTIDQIVRAMTARSS